MPFPVLDEYYTELEAIVAQQFNAASQSLNEWLSVDHKADGHHGAVIADSVTVTGDLRVIGDTGVEGLTAQTIEVNELHGGQINGDIIEAIILSVISGGVTVFDARQSSPGVYTVSVGSFGNPATLNVTGDVFITDDLDVADDFSVNTNKFTIDGGTGDFTGREFVLAKNQNATSSWIIQNTDTTNTNSRARLRVIGGTVDAQVLAIAGAGGYAGTLTAHPFTLFSNNLDAMSIDVNQNIAFDTNTLYVDAANNRVGIGTASPGVPLDVALANAANAVRLISTTTTNAAYITINNNATRGFFGRDNSAGNAIGTASRAYALAIWQESNNDIEIGVNNTEVAYYTSSRYGVKGTLRMDGASQRTIEATDGAYRSLKFDAADFAFYISGALAVTINSSGDVDAGLYKAGGTSGIDYGPGSVSSITVKGGIVTAITP